MSVPSKFPKPWLMPEWVQETGQKLITDTDFNAKVKTASEDTKAFFIKNDCETALMPQLLIYAYDKEGEEHMTAVGLVTEGNDFNEKKHIMLRDMGKLYAKSNPNHRVRAIVLVCEAWMKQMGKDEELPTGKRVSDFDNKVEIIGVQGLTLDMRASGIMFKVLRDEHENISLGARFISPYNPNDTDSISEPTLLLNFYDTYVDCMKEVLKSE